MITTERLEELIKRGATIWNDYIGEYKLNKNQCKICKVTDMEFNFIGYCLWCEYEYDGEIHTTEIKLEDIEENVERGKWHYKIIAERIDRFDPPMWEDLVTPYQFTFILRCKKDSRDMGTYALYVYQSGIMIEEDVEAHAQRYLFNKDFTKENYEKACEIVRDLFNKGGVK